MPDPKLQERFINVGYVITVVSPSLYRPAGYRAAGDSGRRILHPLFSQWYPCAASGGDRTRLFAGMADGASATCRAFPHAVGQRGADYFCRYFAARYVCHCPRDLAAGGEPDDRFTEHAEPLL